MTMGLGPAILSAQIILTIDSFMEMDNNCSPYSMFVHYFLLSKGPQSGYYYCLCLAFNRSYSTSVSNRKQMLPAVACHQPAHQLFSALAPSGPIQLYKHTFIHKLTIGAAKESVFFSVRKACLC